jgi:peptidoglycan/LPS O-acetylase OafA/YrhL
MSEQSSNAKVDGLTIVRFFAALGVFFDHYGTKQLESVPVFLRNLLDRGSAGVLLFFILSGFLLVMVYAPRHPDGKVNKKKFYVARVARVYPAYLLASLVSLPLLYTWVKANGWGEAFSKPIFFFTKLSMTDYWYYPARDHYATASWMQQGWSLTCEGLFYLLFPLALPLLMRCRGWALLGVFLFASAWGTLSGMFLDTGSAAYQAKLGFFSVDPIMRLSDFLMGMAAAKAMLDYRERVAKLKPLVPWVIVGTIIYQASTPELQAESVWFLSLRWVYVLLICAVGIGFVAPSPAPEKPSKFRNFMVLLGEASYGLYLIQFFVTGAIDILSQKVLKIPKTTWDTWPGFFFMLVCAVTASILMHKYFEGPARKAIQKRFS